jgi:hypothetical protein
MIPNAPRHVKQGPMGRATLTAHEPYGWKTALALNNRK